jgi:hypothetical protein
MSRAAKPFILTLDIPNDYGYAMLIFARAITFERYQFVGLLSLQFQSGYRINMTVRVLFFPFTYMSLLLKERRTMVILGLKAGGLSRC